MPASSKTDVAILLTAGWSNIIRGQGDRWCGNANPKALPMDHRDRLGALKRVPLLAGLSVASLERVARDCSWREFAAGEQLVNYQDTSTEVFFLTAGRVRVVVYSMEGKAVLFTDLKPGAMFGEIAAIDRAGRSAGVEALQAGTIASLSAIQFEELLLREPQFALATLKHVAAEVR